MWTVSLVYVLRTLALLSQVALSSPVISAFDDSINDCLLNLVIQSNLLHLMKSLHISMKYQRSIQHSGRLRQMMYSLTSYYQNLRMRTNRPSKTDSRHIGSSRDCQSHSSVVQWLDDWSTYPRTPRHQSECIRIRSLQRCM